MSIERAAIDAKPDTCDTNTEIDEYLLEQIREANYQPSSQRGM